MQPKKPAETLFVQVQGLGRRLYFREAISDRKLTVLSFMLKLTTLSFILKLTVVSS